MSGRLTVWEKLLIALTAVLLLFCVALAWYDSFAVPMPSYLREIAPAAPIDAYLVNLNTASPEQLRELPGIGETLSARIVEFREEHGAYSCIEDLSNVPGISERMVEELRGLIMV